MKSLKLTSLLLVCMLFASVTAMAEKQTVDEMELYPFPILMTSAGQSADVQMLYAIANRSGIEAEVRPLILAEDFDPDVIGTLVIAVGGSGKGLGAAGIDADEETKRVSAILEKAEGRCPIIVAHLGGEARRGELSDRFIKLVIPHADFMLIVEGGDGNDNLFSKIAEESGIPLVFAENIASVGEVFAQIFDISKDVK